MIMVVVWYSGESRVEVRNSFSEEIGSGATCSIQPAQTLIQMLYSNDRNEYTCHNFRVNI